MCICLNNLVSAACLEPVIDHYTFLSCTKRVLYLIKPASDLQIAEFDALRVFGVAFRSLQDEVHCELLHVLPAVPGPGPGLLGLCVIMEQPVARRFRLGRLVCAVQLAPCPDGIRAGRSVRLR